MSNREHILQTARRLAVETGSVPSLDVVAQRAGVSKGGLMHHFSSRAALLDGIATQTIADMDLALTEAVPRGRVVETWLRLSSSREDAALYRAMLVLFSDTTSMTETLLQRAAEASSRWERMLADEVGDPTTASIVRLLGDGMLMNSITNDAMPTPEAILLWLNRRAADR